MKLPASMTPINPHLHIPNQLSCSISLCKYYYNYYYRYPRNLSRIQNVEYSFIVLLIVFEHVLFSHMA